MDKMTDKWHDVSGKGEAGSCYVDGGGESDSCSGDEEDTVMKVNYESFKQSTTPCYNCHCVTFW